MTAQPEDVPVIDLSRAPGSGEAGNRALPVMALWLLAEVLVISNPLQVSSWLRVQTLRAFGAQVGRGVIIRQRVRVKFPWKLRLGDRCWIGEGVWIHNQDRVVVGDDVVLSQETFITTGSHRARSDMGLVTRPVLIEDGAWLTTRCMVLGGTQVGRSALARPGTVLRGRVATNGVVSGPDCTMVGQRFQ